MSDFFEHGYALIVGVNDNMIPNLALREVGRDVQALHEVLLHPQRCGYMPDNVKLLVGPESTGANILAAFDWLREKVNGDPEATAVIYYSGHGMVNTADDSYYLIPYDTEVPEYDDDFLLGVIPAETLTAKIAAIKPKRKLTILDCCHAAGMDVKQVDMAGLRRMAKMKSAAFPEMPEVEDVPEGLPAPGAKSVGRFLALRDGEGRAVLNSSTGAESSFVRPEWGMSVFTYHLIEALTGHASRPKAEAVNVADLMSHVAEKVRASARDIQQSQTPIFRMAGMAFPVALIAGGQGIAKGMGGKLPNPLEPLPPVAPAVTINQQGQTVDGHQAVITGDAHIGQIGDSKTVKKKKVDKSKKIGLQIKGDVGGSVAGRDMKKKEGGVKISASGGSSVKVDAPIAGRDQQITTYQNAGDRDELAELFAPLLAEAARQNQAAAAQVEALQAEIARGEEADDDKVANLVGDIADAAPAVVETLIGLFSNSIVAKAAGAGTQFILRRIRR